MNVLFATDFTEASNHAFKETITLFDRPEHTIFVLHVHTEDHPHTEEEVRFMLDKMMATVSDDGVLLFKSGVFAKVVAEVVISESIDLIVTGSRQKSPLDRLTKGTHTMDLAILLDVPIMEVPVETDLNYFEHICLSADEDLITEPMESLSFLKDLIREHDSRLTVLHVRGEGVEARLSDKTVNQLHRYLGDIEHSHYSMVNNDPFEGITHYLSKHEVDLLVTAPRDRTFLESIFHESITEQMLYNTKTPILILPQ